MARVQLKYFWIPGKQAQKVLWVLRLVEKLEHVPGQDLKKLINTEDIWEVRGQLGNRVVLQ